MRKRKKTLTSGLASVGAIGLTGWGPRNPQSDEWRQQMIWFNVAVSGVLVFEIFPNLNAG